MVINIQAGALISAPKYQLLLRFIIIHSLDVSIVVCIIFHMRVLKNIIKKEKYNKI